MTYETDSQNSVLRRYLLGSTPEDERERLEQALLADENLYEDLLATEDEIIDQYVWGRLPEPERASFLQYLGALPDHEKRLEFAQALREHTLDSREEGLVASGGAQGSHEERSGSGSRVPAFFWAAAVLLILLGGVWSLTTMHKKQNDTLAEGRQQASRRPEESRPSLEPVGRIADGTVPAPSRSFLLTAGTLRSGGTTRVLRMPEKPALVEFRLDLGFADYEAYRAVFHNSQGVELMSLSPLRARIQEDEILVAFSIPSERFTAGDYYISLSGVIENGELEPVARYDFRIPRE